ncbi:MAG: tetratricopeptide repeat protein [Bacteroidota bacterium]
MESQNNRLNQLLSFLEGSPKDPFIRFAIAKEYENLNRQEEAINYYQLLVNESPEYVGTYYHFGKILQKKGDEDAALKIFDQGLKVAKDQGDQHAYNELAGARLEIDDFDE